MSIPVRAGDAIGTTSGLDLSLFDARSPPLTFANAARWIANPDKFDRFHVVPFSDYFTEPARSTVRAMLGSFDGRTRRTVEPIGGTIATDVRGTLQGAWFNPAQPTNPESPHLAIVPDNVDPSRIHVSMGTSQPGFLSTSYEIGAPAATGFVNRNPASVTPGAQIWCYEFLNQFGMALVQLTDSATLRFEGRNGAARNCASELPWTFTSAAVTFKR